ncbi:OmpA family protein [Hahella ganghwensis]|uniref:OmpA family protein n=1 Tax=Hahella ganghwensis TaxID=286420 RepID=UPI00037CD650|nr:OmpA family protein [Hahella ganghwensis]
MKKRRHTDDTGSEQHNLDLSKARAESVANALTKDFGIASARLMPRGAGPWVPQSRTGSLQTKKLNRRVELVLSLPKK